MKKCALTWWIIQSLFNHHSGHFWQTCFCKHCKPSQ